MNSSVLIDNAMQSGKNVTKKKSKNSLGLGNEIKKRSSMALNNRLKNKASGNNESTVNLIMEDDFDGDEDEELDEENESICPPPKVIWKFLKTYANLILDSIPWIMFMMCITFYVLFISDITAFFENANSLVFDTIQLACFSLFLLELSLQCLFVDNYIFSFYFWLDFISTISMLTEINIIFDLIMNMATATDEETTTTSGTSNASSIKAASRFTRALSTMRITRIVRVIRIIRIIRVVKLYKTAILSRKRMEEQRLRQIQENLKKEEQTNKEKKTKFNFKDRKNNNENFILNKKRKATRDKGKYFGKLSKNKVNVNREERKTEILKLRENNLIEEFEKENGEDNNIKNEDANAVKADEIEGETDAAKDNLVVKESSLNKIVTESITRKVITLILLMSMLMPVLEPSLYDTNSAPISHQMIVKYLSGFVFNNTNKKFDFRKYDLTVQKLMMDNQDPTSPIINITYLDALYFKNETLSNYTFKETEVKIVANFDYTIMLYYSAKGEVVITSVLSILKTIFVGVVIVFAAITMEGDVNDLLLTPMKVIFEIIETVTKDPNKARNQDFLNNGIYNIMENIDDKDENNKSKKSKKTKKNKTNEEITDNIINSNYEVNIVKTSICKISSLIASGLGFLGCEMLKLMSDNNQESRLNFKLKGKKNKSIIVYVKIKNLHENIQYLKEKITLYFNQIIEYFSFAADIYGGSLLSIHDDQLVFVWNFKTLKEFKNTKIYNKDVKQMTDMCMCFVFESIKQLKCKKRLKDWKSDPYVVSSKIDIEPQITLSLHIGSNLEGLIGSADSKIDPTFYSKNLSLLTVISDLCNTYGVEILMTDSFYSQLSDEMKQTSRLIDVVKIKESPTNIKLYTIDMNKKMTGNRDEDIVDDYTISEKIKYYDVKKEKIRKFLSGRGGKDNKLTTFAFSKNGYKELLLTDLTSDYFRFFDKAINDYIYGEWKSAKANLELCIGLNANDMPLKFLYNFLRDQKFKPIKKGENKWTGKRIVS